MREVTNRRPTRRHITPTRWTFAVEEAANGIIMTMCYSEADGKVLPSEKEKH